MYAVEIASLIRGVLCDRRTKRQRRPQTCDFQTFHFGGDVRWGNIGWYLDDVNILNSDSRCPTDRERVQ